MNQPSSECNITWAQRKPAGRSLENLLQRAQSHEAPGPSQLALPAPNPSQLALPAPNPSQLALPAPPLNADPPQASVQQQPVSKVLAVPESLVQGQSPTLLALPPAPDRDESTQAKPKPAAEDSQETHVDNVNDLPHGRPNSVSLAESMAKLQTVRSNLKDLAREDVEKPVMKKPCRGPSMQADKTPPTDQKPQSSQTSKVIKMGGSKSTSSQTKNKTKKTVSKSGGSKDKSKPMSPEQRRRLRDAILSKLDLKTKKNLKMDARSVGTDLFAHYLAGRAGAIDMPWPMQRL